MLVAFAVIVKLNNYFKKGKSLNNKNLDKIDLQ